MIEENKVFELLSKYVFKDVSVEEIELLYNSLENFKTATPDLVLNKEKMFLPKDIDIIDCTFCGIDLPKWYNKNSDSEIRLMIVGIDPLRNEKTFKQHSAAVDRDVIIGTPYALHDEKMRNGKTKVYWNFIEHLIQKYFVYLTDIFKLYFHHKSENVRSYIYLDKHELTDLPIKLLSEEIQLINPSHIIAFGNMAYDNLMKLQKTNEEISDSITIIWLPHPAAHASTWIPLTKTNASANEKVKYMSELVSSKL